MIKLKQPSFVYGDFVHGNKDGSGLYPDKDKYSYFQRYVQRYL